MLTDEMFAKLFDFNPFSNPKIRKKAKVSIYVLCTIGLIFFLELTTVILTYFSVELLDLQSFMKKLNLIHIGGSSVFNMWYLLAFRKLPAVFLEDFQDLDTLLGKGPSSKPDFVLVAILSAVAAHALASVRMVPLAQKGIYFFIVMANVAAAFRLVALKYMVYKRMSSITALARSGNLQDLFNSTRRLLTINDQINGGFSHLLVDGLGGGLVIFLHSLVAYWQVYGLHHAYDCFEYEAPFFTLAANGYIVFTLPSVAVSSSAIDDMVAAFSWEIDRAISTETLPLELRKKYRVMMLELAHRPLELTAMDFFTVDNTTVTAACGFVMSCMMLFIQFMT